MLAHLGVRGAHLLRREWARQRQGGGRAAAETDGGGDLALLEQGDVLDQQREHPLALARRGVRVAPHGREVGREVQDPLTCRRVDDQPIGGTLALIVLLSLGEPAQFDVPVGLQRAGDEPVGRVHLHVPMAGAVHLVLRPFDLAVAQAVGLIEAGGYLLLNGTRHLEGHGGDGLHQQRADGGIDRAAQYALARRITEESPSPKANVVGDELATTAVVVVHVHAAAAHAADGVPLQQRRPFARRAPAALEGDRPGGEQLLLVALVLRPRHVGRVCLPDQHVPLLLRQAFVPRRPVGPLAPAAPAVGVGAGVPRIVQGTGGAAQGQRRPRQFPLARPGRHAGGKEQPLLPEKLDRGMERPGAGEGGKEQPHALLHLRVGVEDHPPGAVVHQAHRQPAAQLAAAGFVENAATQARPQDVQLRLAHRPLQPEQQAVVEVRRIVDAVFVEDQGVGQRADLEQAVPVGRVARQARDLQPQHDPGAALVQPAGSDARCPWRSR